MNIETLISLVTKREELAVIFRMHEGAILIGLSAVWIVLALNQLLLNCSSSTLMISLYNSSSLLSNVVPVCSQVNDTTR